MGGDMQEDSQQKLIMKRGVGMEAKERKRVKVISKLIGARSEVEDVLLCSNDSAVLSSQERLRLSILMWTIDNIVRRVEQCS
jgi:putative lipase involved disintegration of autophagic bodies